jgi:hypothetical protein
MVSQSFILSVTKALALTNALAYYGIRTLRISNVFYNTGPGFCNAERGLTTR